MFFSLNFYLSKWKADRTSVHAVQVSPKGDCLLSAGRDIRLWDIEKKEILQVCVRYFFSSKISMQH